MLNILKLSRELGGEIVNSTLSIKLENARVEAENDLEAFEIKKRYLKLRDNYTSEKNSDVEKANVVLAELNEVMEEMKNNKILMELINLEKQYKDLIAKSINVLKAVASGELSESEELRVESLEGKCGGCKGCRK